MNDRMVVALAGGVGGAKLAQGLYQVLPPGNLTVIVNTADDFVHLGLHISPDLDTVLYTLAGIAHPDTGWGIAGDTYGAMAMVERYGGDTWFRLGDRDLATHVLRTDRLHRGATLTEVTAELALRLGITATILPMCDEPVSTVVATTAGTLAFQDYFVRRRHQDEVVGIEFAGWSSASVPAAVAAAVRQADAIIVCPSNPFVSVGPILAIPGMRHLLMGATAPRVAVSPIVGGQAIKGPAGAMLASLGHHVSPLGVARLYAGLLDGMVIDEADLALAGDIAALGPRVVAAPTIMGGRDDRARLARDVLALCEQLAAPAEAAL